MSSVGVLHVPVLYVRWTVNIWDKTKKDSDDFRFQGLQWYLKYDPRTETHDLDLWLRSPGHYVPFNATWHLEDPATGRILSKLSKRKHVEKVLDCVFASWTPSEIEQSVPHFRRTYDLTFLVELRAEDALTENSSSRETQTDECYPPEVVIPSSSTSTSVQTVLNMSNVPCLGSLSEDFSKLLVEQNSEPDVEFRCADYSTKAHRLIVSARSPVIASMLTTDMLEKKTGVVSIPDMDPDIFRQFLRYLYTGQLEELTFDTAMSLYEAGDQYSVLGLAKKCSTFLVENISVKNACEVLVVADAHSDSDLVEKVVNYMVENTVPLIFDRWPDFCDEHPKLANEVLNYGWKTLIKRR